MVDSKGQSQNCNTSPNPAVASSSEVQLQANSRLRCVVFFFFLLDTCKQRNKYWENRRSYFWFQSIFDLELISWQTYIQSCWVDSKTHCDTPTWKCTETLYLYLSFPLLSKQYLHHTMKNSNLCCMVLLSVYLYHVIQLVLYKHNS